jgi:hypothetical protein
MKGESKMSETTGCDCLKLVEMNMKKRKHGSIKTAKDKEAQSKAVVGEKDPITKQPTGEKTTISSMCFQKPKTKTIFKTSHNSQKAMVNVKHDLEEGQAVEDRKNKNLKSKLCDEANYTHPNGPKSGTSLEYSGHTEARLLDGLGKDGFPTSGNLTLAIDWRKKGQGGVSSPMPCKTCHKLLCAALDCGIKIWLCDEGHHKQELKKKEHCSPANNKTYQKLKDTLQPSNISHVY